MIAVVTGGTKGIGLSVLKNLVDNGFYCIAVSRGETDEIKELAKQGKAEFFPCDIGSPDDRKRFADYLTGKGEIGVLVNCAGVAPKVRHDMLEMSEEEFDYVLNINQKGTFFITQIVANIMKNQKFGRIIFISSLSSYTASPERAQYCISKSSISMFTKLYAARMAEYGVYVFEVSPGIVETDMTSCVKEKYDRLIDEGLTPIKRIGQPDDVGKAVLSLASGNFDFCTGTVIQADGGFSVRRL